MPPKTKPTIQNLLWQSRQRAGLKQKQIAKLINHRSTNQISQYETGKRVPPLETALLLSLIYRVPVRWLFFGLFENLQKELKTYWEQTGSEQALHPLNQFCALEESLQKTNLTAEEYKLAKAHSIVMIKKLTALHAEGRFTNE